MMLLAQMLPTSLGALEELLGWELRSSTVSLQGSGQAKPDGADLADLVPSDAMGPLELAEQAERAAAAWDLLDRSSLTLKERRVVMLRFGLDDSNEWRTLAEVARELDCSREYCRQVVQRALDKLRSTGIATDLMDAV